MVRYASALVLVSCSLAAQSLPERIDAVLAGGAASRALWGIHVIELPSGRMLYERNAFMPLTPASNMKLLTTALALKTFGAAHRFETKVIETPEGDLILLGGADPSMSGRIYPYVREGSADPKEPLAATGAAGCRRGRDACTGRPDRR